MSDERGIIVVTELKRCSRCGEEHGPCNAEMLDRPIEFGIERFTHWFACPTNGQPVLVRLDMAVKA